MNMTPSFGGLYYVNQAIEVQDLSHVTMISTDETSTKKGHNYVTIFMDPEKRSVKRL
ncbi:hypothetical protein [Peribacillus loiseleuriae]|uniref:hypothetical protein n=1 Tax=Peribacillus loiseleuriae TaxID=1679170 RepID=UPI003D00845B